MNELFGFSMDTIMHLVLAAVLIVSGVLGVLAWRNRLFLKLGLRNIPRRRAQSMLIVLGLMLATVITMTAFVAGDTLSYSIRSSAVRDLGFVDETLTAKSATVQVDRSAAAPAPAAFSASVAQRLARALAQTTNVDGVTGVLVEPLAIQDLTTRQAKPAGQMVGVPARYPGAFGALRSVAGRPAGLDRLGVHQVDINQVAAQGLNARAGDRLRLFVGSRSTAVTVRSIVPNDGLAGGGLLTSGERTDPAVLLPLGRAQNLAGRHGQITQVLISNRGDAVSGAVFTGQVERQVRHVLPNRSPYVLNPVKQDGITSADEVGSNFTAGFLAFGLFSIIAGIMLIFLIFVMLAAERRTEMGMARAVGTRRRHLIQQLLFEGYAYNLAAATLGIAAGILVGVAIDSMLVSIAKSSGFFTLQRHIEPRSVVVAFCLGMLVTFVTVLVSSWRVSRLNVVAAVRDISEELGDGIGVRDAFSRPVRDLARAARRFRARRVVGAGADLLSAPWHFLLAFRVFVIRGPLVLIAGVLVFRLGSSSNELFPFDLGVSLLLIGSALLVRWILGSLGVANRIRDRLCYSLAGVALVIFWLLPFDFFRSDLQFGPEMFVLAGVMITLGGVWAAMFNVDLLLDALLTIGGSLGRLTPAIKMAVTYPLQHRFRTGMTLFMYSLVMFALMVGAVAARSFGAQPLNLNRSIGGYDVYGMSSPTSPIRNVAARMASDPLLRRSISASGGISQVPVDLRQPGQPRQNGNLTAYVADDAYLASTHFSLHGRAVGYRSDAAVWHAVRTHPGFAVLDGDLVASTSGSGFSVIRGFRYEDTTFRPAQVVMQDSRTGKTTKLTVIGVLDQAAARLETSAPGVYISRSSLIALHDPIPAPNIVFFRIAPGHNVHRVELAIGSAFLSHGLDVHDVRADYVANQSLSTGFDNLLVAFIGLGLIVGIAALGVVATRSVVERRQQIGMLRAIGFRRAMVQITFLLESSFVAILGTLLGTGLGLLMAIQVVDYFMKRVPGLHVVIPWPEVALIVLAAYLASLLTIYLPAWQASRVYPAEALRYE